ncbi:helix-hairpin-helix domain-containing protein [Glaciibacter superstes]|uniref:helix-hairpin-helix domain-containing protein n=1 Tax=Glaciibacter superstes TaxID=501023 RepID=UPI0003B64DDB|nr:helix-hairpin-helix domain-containing protein [Glaciibacter superstes]
MEPEAPNDPLARLAQGARVPERARLRLGVGAAVVLLIVALVVAVVVSALAQQANQRVLAPGEGVSTPGATGSWSPDGVVGDAEADAAGAIIFVHVLGAVSRPGLFELHEGARVMDAVAAAGGLLDTADPGGVNLARVLSDGEQLTVPAIGEVAPGAAPGGAAPGAGGDGSATVVNLNTATVGDLETLPRIGPTLAQRIIDYRDANGRFGSIDDLRNVSGIGDKTFDGLKDLITV